MDKGKEKISKSGKWESLGGDIRMYLPTRSLYAVKSFRYLGIPNLFHCYGPISEREARRLLPSTIEDWKAMHAGKGKKAEKTIADVIPLFLKYESPKNRQRTQDNHRQIFSEINLFFGDLRLSELDEEVYHDRLEGTVKPEKTRLAEERKKERRGARPRKTFNYLAVHLNILMNYSYRKKYTSHLVKLPLTDEYKQAGRVIDHKTAQRLFEELEEEAKDVFMLSYNACMRRNEGLLLTWDRFDRETGLITLRPEDVKTGSRTKKGRSLYVADWIRLRLIARFERQRHLNSPWVFPSPKNPAKPQRSINTAWTGAKRRAGVTGRLRWHDLKHSGIDYLLNICGHDVRKVSEYVGTSVRTLQRVYNHTRPEHTREIGQAIRFD